MPRIRFDKYIKALILLSILISLLVYSRVSARAQSLQESNINSQNISKVESTYNSQDLNSQAKALRAQILMISSQLASANAKLKAVETAISEHDNAENNEIYLDRAAMASQVSKSNSNFAAPNISSITGKNTTVGKLNKLSPNFSHCTIAPAPDTVYADESDSFGEFLALTSAQINKIQFGSDGPSTLKTNCNLLDSALIGDSSAALGGAQISYSYDGIQKKTSINIVGSVGYNINAGQLGQISIYGRIDHESLSSIIIANSTVTRPLIYSQKQIEAGFVESPRPLQISSWENFYGFIYIQPLYLDDNLRHSKVVAINLRLSPVYPRINEYDHPIKSYNCDVDQGNFACAYFQSNLYYGIISDFHIDAAHFIEPGMPLSQPTAKIASVGQPYNLKNEDYLRVGGHFGAFGQLQLQGIDINSLGTKSITGSLYYAQYSPIIGVHHDLGAVVGQISLPVVSIVKLSLNYINGRSENVAAREETWGFKLSLGSQ